MKFTLTKSLNMLPVLLAFFLVQRRIHACTDSETFTFGQESIDDGEVQEIDRNCAWIHADGNTTLANHRRFLWCQQPWDNIITSIADECPLACDACPGRPSTTIQQSSTAAIQPRTLSSPCDDDDLHVIVNITTANSATLNYWTITSTDGGFIRSETFQQHYANYVKSLCLPSSECHVFVIDGIFYGPDLNSLTVDGRVYDEEDLRVSSSGYYEYGDDDYYTTHVPLIKKLKFGSTCITDSPSSQPSSQPSAIPSTTPSLNHSLEPSPSPSDQASKISPSLPEECKKGQKKFVLRLKTDDFGAETSFELRKRNDRGQFNKVVFSADRFRSNEEIVVSKCVPQKRCLKLLVFDSYGDGMCCENGRGYWKAYYNNKGVVREEKGDFTDGKISRSKSFGKCD